MIGDLLGRYYVFYGSSKQFQIIESYVLNNHEVAWVEITDTSSRSVPYTFRNVLCECDFTRGTGWQVDDSGYPYGLKMPQPCLDLTAVMYRRNIELRREYQEYFTKQEPSTSTRDMVEHVLLDLIEKVKQGVMIGERASSAQVDGGFYHINTAATILNKDTGYIYEVIERMWTRRLIELYGPIIKGYGTPPLNNWKKSYQVEESGWTAIAKMPTHQDPSSTFNTWHYEIYRPNGVKYANYTGATVFHGMIPETSQAEDDKSMLKNLTNTLHNVVKTEVMNNP